MKITNSSPNADQPLSPDSSNKTKPTTNINQLFSRAMKTICLGIVTLSLLCMPLSSCSSDHAVPTEPDASYTAEPNTFPVTIEHKFGSTTIPQAPHRIVVVGLNEQDFFLSLGVTPIADTQWLNYGEGGIGPWTKPELHGTQLPHVLSEDSPTLVEDIAALDPDVIVGIYSELDDVKYHELSQIAPVIAQPKNTSNYTVPWQNELETIGKILGKPKQAALVKQQVETTFNHVTATHPQFANKTTVMAAIDNNELAMLASGDTRSRFLTALGFKIPTRIDELASSQFFTSVSIERTDLINTDLLFWEEDSTEHGFDKLSTDKNFASQNVIKQKHVIVINDTGDIFNALTIGSPLSYLWVLPKIIPAITAALEGKPQTLN